METSEIKDLAVEASQVLANNPVSELRSLRVDEQSNELQLRGSVRSFYHKQLAQEAVLPLACGKQVVNYVDVQN